MEQKDVPENICYIPAERRGESTGCRWKTGLESPETQGDRAAEGEISPAKMAEDRVSQ